MRYFCSKNELYMTEYNPIMTTPDEQFVVGNTDLRYFEEHSCRTEGGVILFCRRGSATVTVDQLCDRITRDTLLLLLPGSILHLNERTDDFRVRFCAFSLELFSEAAYRLDPSFSTSCTSMRSSAFRPGSLRGRATGFKWPPTPIGIAITFSAIQLFATGCRTSCWRLSTKRGGLLPMCIRSRAPRARPIFSNVSWLLCTNIARSSARWYSMPTGFVYRRVICPRSSAAWPTRRPRSSSTARWSSRSRCCSSPRNSRYRRLPTGCTSPTSLIWAVFQEAYGGVAYRIPQCKK